MLAKEASLCSAQLLQRLLTDQHAEDKWSLSIISAWDIYFNPATQDPGNTAEKEEGRMSEMDGWWEQGSWDAVFWDWYGHCTHKFTAAVVVHTRWSQQDRSSILTGNSNGTQWVIEGKIKGEDLKLRIFRGIWGGVGRGIRSKQECCILICMYEIVKEQIKISWKCNLLNFVPRLCTLTFVFHIQTRRCQICTVCNVHMQILACAQYILGWGVLSMQLGFTIFTWQLLYIQAHLHLGFSPANKCLLTSTVLLACPLPSASLPPLNSKDKAGLLQHSRSHHFPMFVFSQALMESIFYNFLPSQLY